MHCFSASAAASAGPNIGYVVSSIESLRSQAGYKPAFAGAANAVAKPAAIATAPRPRSPYTDGRPVFGKRV